MVLSYPELPADVLAGAPAAAQGASAAPSATARRAPRNGLVSGCFPLDPFYVSRPEAARLKQVKEALRA